MNKIHIKNQDGVSPDITKIDTINLLDTHFNKWDDQKIIGSLVELNKAVPVIIDLLKQEAIKRKLTNIQYTSIFSKITYNASLINETTIDQYKISNKKLLNDFIKAHNKEVWDHIKFDSAWLKKQELFDQNKKKYETKIGETIREAFIRLNEVK